MSQLRSRFVDAGPFRLHLLEAGAEHPGPPVLFLHGWPTNAWLYRHVLAAVGARRWALALDLPGFGRSSKPLDQAYDFACYDAAFDALLDALGLERLGLCVHDAGGALGLHWATQHPERLVDLCLLNTVASSQVSLAVRAFLWSMHVPGLRRAYTSPWGLAQTLQLGVRTRRLDPATLELYLEPYREEAARTVFERTTQALTVTGLRALDERLPRLAAIPTLLLYGARDLILPEVARTMRFAQRCLPLATRTELPRLGHFLHEDDPEGVATALADFFQPRGGQG